jgi:integrase
MFLVDRPKPKRGIPRPVPDAVLNLYRQSAETGDDLLMFDLAALQGMRRGEIAGLRTDNIDMDRDVLVVCGKGDRIRAIPIHAEVRDRLAAKAASSSEWVFPSPRGRGHIHPRTAGRRVTAMMGGAYTTHQLRHRFATAVYKASGNDIRVTQELLGHANITTTQIYTQVDSASLIRAVAGV